MNIKRKAFTLTELMVALSVIGVLTAILMPVIKNLMPDQNALMAKRANYTIETVVSNLLNDSACYPDEVTQEGDLISPFANGYGYVDCECWGGDRDASAEDHISDWSLAGEKFKRLFADKLQLATKLEDIKFGNEEVTEFDTKDGLHWVLSLNGDNIRVAVDVNNGNRKSVGDVADAFGEENENADYTQEDDAKEYDVAVFDVTADGNIAPIGDWTSVAVDINTPVTGGNKLASNDKCQECIDSVKSMGRMGKRGPNPMVACSMWCKSDNESEDDSSPALDIGVHTTQCSFAHPCGTISGSTLQLP